jgi:hypothetical protein
VPPFAVAVVADRGRGVLSANLLQEGGDLQEGGLMGDAKQSVPMESALGG